MFMIFQKKWLTASKINPFPKKDEKTCHWAKTINTFISALADEPKMSPPADRKKTFYSLNVC